MQIAAFYKIPQRRHNISAYAKRFFYKNSRWRIYRQFIKPTEKACIIVDCERRRIFLKKLCKLCALLLAFVLVFGGCKKEEEKPEEDNPTDFSYDMLDLSRLVDEIYSITDMGELTAASVSKVTDKTVLTEQYYLNLDNVLAMDVRSAEGKYGVADVAIIRAAEGKGDEIMESLERRKDDRINEFSNYDVYESYSIAMNADIYQTGELVVMLMINDEAKSEARTLIDSYLP